MQVKITTEVQTQYIRNNKSNGQKNLRCFPRCAMKGGHRMAGFCGSHLDIQLLVKDDPQYLSLLTFQKAPSNASSSSSSSSSSSNDDATGEAGSNRNSSKPVPALNFNHVFVFGEFLAFNEAEGKNSEIVEGEYYDAAPIFHILNLDRSKCSDNLSCPRPFVAKRVVESKDMNSHMGLSTKANYVIEPTCWHYGWKSHKHSNGMKHFLRVYAMYLIGNKFLCLGMDDTTQFTVASSKRFRRTYSEDMIADISGTPIVKRQKGDSPLKRKARKSSLNIMTKTSIDEFITGNISSTKASVYNKKRKTNLKQRAHST